MTGSCEIATFAAGCFWCVEAVFADLRGVTRVTSGYAGGTTKNPTYEQVCTGGTGHAEAVQIAFDPSLITYRELLDVFWHTHDPTTPNRQGPDSGTQYRSAIFYHDEGQRTAAVQSKREAEKAGIWPDPIVTEIAPLAEFYPAEDYHRNYYRDHPNQQYCRLVINPKLAKFRMAYRSKIIRPGECP
jgi:peptide-methionine (S)-S-oxide reductase